VPADCEYILAVFFMPFAGAILWSIEPADILIRNPVSFGENNIDSFFYAFCNTVFAFNSILPRF
jgi:hypothetical protein